MLGSFAGGGLGFGLAMSLRDSFSGPAAGIQTSLNTLDGKVSKVSASISKNMSRLGKGALIAGVGALALGVTFGAPIKRAIELSDKLADVRKTTNLTEVEVNKFKKTLQGLDTRTSLDDLLDISRIGGQIGIAKKDLEGFTIATDKLAVALSDEFTGGADQVASEIGGIGKAFGVFKEKGVEQGMLNIGNALNKLGAEGLATAPYLSNFATRLAPVARSANATAGDVIGLGAAFSELKLAPERASSGILRAVNIMGNNLDGLAEAAGLNLQEFKDQFEKNGIVALLKFSEGLKKNSTSSADWLQKLKKLQLGGVSTSMAIGSMANNVELFEEKIRSAGLGMEDTASIMFEFGVKNNTLAASIEKMGKKWDNIIVLIGDMSKGPFSWIIAALDNFLSLIGRFLQTGIGKFILSLVAALGTLAVVIGVAIASAALFKIALIKMSFAFGQATAASIAHAVATGRLSIAFKLMGRAAWKSAVAMWTAFAPLLPIILPIVAAIALLAFTINSVRKGMDTFNTSTTESLSKLTGFKKLITIIGGVFTAIKEFWQFFDGTNSGITQTTYDRLQALGISKETIETLGSYVVRAKAIFVGFKEAFVGVWNALKVIWSSTIKPMFKAIWDTVKNVFSSFGIDIGKLGGGLDKFKIIGKFLAGMIMAVLIPAVVGLTVAVGTLALGVLVIVAPILLFVGAIYGIVQAFRYWGEILDWLLDKWNQYTNWVGGLITTAANWGADLVTNIWEGVKNKWTSFTDWMSNAWSKLVQSLNPLNLFDGGGDNQITTSNKVSYEHSLGKGQLAMANTAPYTAMSEMNPNVNVDASQGPLYNNIYLDGEPIAQNVMERQKMDNALK